MKEEMKRISNGKEESDLLYKPIQRVNTKLMKLTMWKDWRKAERRYQKGKGIRSVPLWTPPG